MESTYIKHVNAYQNTMVSQGKAIWVLNWIYHSFHEASFILEWTTDQQSMVIETWISDRHFCENERSKPVTSEKTDSNFCQ